MERFSERAHRVVEVAEAEARELNHPYLGTEHLLLGLIAVEGPAQHALASAGATADASRAKVAEAVGPRRSAQRGDPQLSLALSPRARRALDRASRLSLQRRDPEVEPEHLLIGVLDVEGRAGQVLRGVGVDVAALRVSIDLSKEEESEEEAAAAAAASSTAAIPRSPHCPECGAGVEDRGMAYRIIAASDEVGRRREFVVTSCSACGAVLGTSAVHWASK